MDELSHKLWAATTLAESVALIKPMLEERLRDLDGFLRRRDKLSLSMRSNWKQEQKIIQAELRSLDQRLQRHDSLQAKRKVPAFLRKRIREIEILYLYDVYSPHSDDSGRARNLILAELYEEADRILNPPKPFAESNPAFEVGKSYAAQVITKAYDRYVWAVLKSYFERVPGRNGQRQTWRILAALPQKEAYLSLKEKHFTRPVERLVLEAYGVLGAV